MKKITLVALACVFSASAFSQVDSNRVTGSTARIGLEAGLNLPTYQFHGTNSGSYDARTITSFQVTAFTDFGINNGLFIQPGVSLRGKGTKANVTDPAGGYTLQHNVLSVDVPVNLVGRLPIGREGAFQFLVGPYLGFPISGKQEVTRSNVSAIPNAERDLVFGDSAGDDLSGIDYGANAGLRYRATEGLNFGASYGYGMKNIFPDNNGALKAYNRGFSFSIGFSL